MTSTPRTPNNDYFLTEAQDLLRIIEQGVFSLRSDRTPARVHELMRAAHTLKGAAASVELNAISNVAHVLEDIFRAFYNPEVEIDAEVEALLFQGYECLRLLLTAQFDGIQIDESDVLNRAADIIAQLQAKLGDRFDRDAPIPTSTELGFDMVQSMFQIGVTQRLEELAQAVASNAPDLEEVLRSQIEIFLGLAESLELPGFASIAQTALTALNQHPAALHDIAQIALRDFQQGRAAVLAGDRQQGGTPSLQLQQFASSTLISEAIEPGHQQDATGREQDADIGIISSTPTSVPIAFPGLSPSPSLDLGSAPLDSEVPSVVPTASTRPNSSFLSGLMRLLQTEIPLEDWLRRVRDWVAPSHPAQLQLPAAESSEKASAEHQAADLPPMLPLEALLGNLELGNLEIQSNSAIAESVADSAPVQLPLANSSEAENAAFAPIQEEKLHEEKLLLEANSSQPLEPIAFENVHLSSRNLSAAPVKKSTSESFPVAFSQTFPELSNLEVQPHSIQENSRFERSPLAVSFQSAPINSAAAVRSASGASVRVDLEKLEKLNYLTGELLINQSQQTSQDNTLRLMVQDLLDRLQKHQHTIDQLCSQGDRLLAYPAGKSSENFSSIVQQFDELEMDRYSELHILSRATLHEVMELKSLSESLDQTARQLGRSLEAQQRLLFVVGNDLTAIRMQPLADLFHRLTQVVQQLAASHQKPVEIAVTGTEVLVDKTIVEKLYDPLLHLVRNAFDHGVEAAEARQAAGKPAIGRIEINAYHQGNRTVIEVKDDGPGIQLQRVAQRAIEMGWLTPEAIATTPESTLLSYLFESGFSTAAQVSSLSGRGVGLDVVRSQVEGFRGAIAVSFVPQQGTTFSLQIPLSLTIAKLLLCKSQGICYALPIDGIEQIISQSDALSQVGNRQVLQWRKGDVETTIVVRSLSELVNDAEPSFIPKEDQPDPATPPAIVLVRTDSGLMGIRVEQVMGEQELIIRPLGRTIAPPPYVYGCCIVGSSQLALVIDVRTLFRQAVDAENPIAAPGTEPDSATNLSAETASLSASAPLTINPFLAAKTASRHFHILLIEDSLTLRQTLAQLLLQTGYQVSQAKDGLEGLAFLQNHPDVDLVICDIEMPRMNGFEFLSQRHQRSDLLKVPVVMLTSRSSDKYRQFAIDLGAADFMTKPYVNQNLLSTVHHLLGQS